MAEWPENRNPGGHRPEFDRTIIRPSGQHPVPPAPPRQPPPPAPEGKGRTSAPPPPGKRSSGLLLFSVLAVVFLILGGGAGGLFHLINSGAITFSPPEEESPGGGGQQVAEAPVVSQPPEKTGDGTRTAAERQEANPDDGDGAVPVNDEELDTPADPFFDMALSAVIPLAGDPVLLGDGEANRRIELTERPVPATSASSGDAAIPTLTAYVLDSRMLDDDGDLVIRAPGSETDFQFGNFGGGEDSERIVVDEGTDDGSSGSGLPVFLKPPTDTLNLYLTELPIGQGASRTEIRKEVKETVPLKEFLKENGFDEDVTGPLLEYARTEWNRSDLVAGDRIAVRGVRMPNKVGRIGDYYRPVQMSIYSGEGYVGTAAFSHTRDGDSYIAGADPWFGKTVVEEKIASDTPEAAPDGKSHRLIDGLYATGVRNAVPASIVGEAIAYLAPMTDLKRTIKPDERFTMVFTGAPRDEKRGGGRVLFAGVRRGDTWSVRCYVLKAPGNRGFACVNEGGQVSLSGAMLVPVKGVLTSKFGMRYHPIKKIERLHAGVDWAAPTGTPIRAAFAGKVTYRDVRGGYGNFIEITHKDGITSRYAHMHEYAEGIELGSVVQAGDLIGYIGTTGLSTGPHLHFEIRMKGEPTDPLAFEMETGTDAPQSVASGDLKDYRTVIAEILGG